MARDIKWPLRPNGTEVPIHRKSGAAYREGYPIFCASDWRCTNIDGRKIGHWMCGYCEKMTTDTRSPHQYDTLADCRKCGKTNRISL